MNSESPCISVIIPAYNQSRYLPDAIRSVFEQTYRDYEIIVVDDGSTDDTSAVAHQFGELIRYVHQENRGLAGARNSGIRLARGQYVTLLDCDDQWSPDFLQKMLDMAIQKPDASVYYSGWQYMDEDGQDLPQAACTRVVSPDRMYRAMLRTNVLNCCTVMIRHAVVEEAGLFDATFRRLEDWDLWLRLLKAGHIFLGIPKSMVRYRLHANSLSRDPSSMQQSVLAVAEKLFGPDDGRWEVWTEEKRRLYGGVYSYHALSSLEYQGNWKRCAVYLRKALQVDPSLALEVDLFYELALGKQPKGFRGTPYKLALEDNLVTLGHLLEEVFRQPMPPEQAKVRQLAIGTAHQAVGLLAYSLGSFPLSRRHLMSAIRFRPGLARNSQVLGFLIRTFVGRSTINRLRSLFS